MLQDNVKKMLNIKKQYRLDLNCLLKIVLLITISEGQRKKAFPSNLNVFVMGPCAVNKNVTGYSKTTIKLH